MRDISEFKKGDIITTIGRQTYEVMDIKYGRVKGKMKGVLSILKDVDTGHIHEASWKNNTIFL